jgi:hypothetical protein
MMTAQKNLFRKKIQLKKYSVLCYMGENDAKGFGPHKFHFTAVVLQLMPKRISKINDGRCFHGPLSYRNSISIHSKEIKISDYNDLKCPEHIYGCMKVLPNISLIFFVNQG